MPPSLKRILVVVPALTALFCIWLTWRQRDLAAAAEASRQAALEERDALHARVAALETEADALRTENSALRTSAANPTRPSAEEHGPNRVFTRAVPGGRMPGPMQLFDSPEMRSLMALEQMGRLDGRYAGLFKALRLDPAQLKRLKELLLEKQNVPADVMAAARQQELLGTGSPGDIQQLIQQESQNVDQGIRELLGETGYDEYQSYERTRAERNAVDQIANRLSYSDDPLSSDQIEALVDLLSAQQATRPASAAQNEPVTMRFAVSAGGGGDATMAFTSAGDGALITDETISAAQDLLSAAQLDALRQIQAEQQARQQMSNLMRDALGPPGAGGRVFIGTPTESGTRAVP